MVIDDSRTSPSNILYGEYIKYDRMYEMSMHAFNGHDIIKEVEVYVDLYSILRKLYIFGDNKLDLNDQYEIAASIINLGIHIRGFFNRFGIASKIYLIYGEAKPQNVLNKLPYFNSKHILMENTNFITHWHIMSSLEIATLYTKYLPDIFTIADSENEFTTIASYLIDKNINDANNIQNSIARVIYSKEPLAYQLVAIKPRCFLFRPKKDYYNDNSWVVTKSSLFRAYRIGELKLNANTKSDNIDLIFGLFPLYQLLNGIKSRNIKSIKNANASLKILFDAQNNGVFSLGYSSWNVIANNTPIENHPIYKILSDPIYGIRKPELFDDMIKTFECIDVINQTLIYSASPTSKIIESNLVNFSDDNAVKEINDKYFTNYPIDLMRL